ncbi:MAG: hypothetical protein ACT4OX_10165 [Actinomycetota bacterium]
MRFRAGLVCGFAAGYFLGARAGRERYELLRSKLRALVDLAIERVKRPSDYDSSR